MRIELSLIHTILLTALSVTLCSAAGSARAFSNTDKARVLYVGDSLAANTVSTVAFWTSAKGNVDFSQSIFAGMALCDFLEVPNAKRETENRLRAQVMNLKPHLVILQFWGNAATPCMQGQAPGSEGYFNQYFWNALAAVNTIADAASAVGIPKPKILWVLQAPDRADLNLANKRIERLNKTYSLVANATAGRTSDAGYHLSLAAFPFGTPTPESRYEWTAFLPCTDFEKQVGYCTDPDAFGIGLAKLHRDDDPLHFCLGNNFLFVDCDTPSPAILRYGMQIAKDASDWLGL